MVYKIIYCLTMWYEFDTCKYWIDYLYSEYKHDIGSIANIYTCVTEEGRLFSGISTMY